MPNPGDRVVVLNRNDYGSAQAFADELTKYYQMKPPFKVVLALDSRGEVYLGNYGNNS